MIPAQTATTGQDAAAGQQQPPNPPAEPTTSKSQEPQNSEAQIAPKPDKTGDAVNRARTVPYYFAAIAGLVYAAGFVVEFTFLNGMGVKDPLIDPFKAKHIYIGILCLFFPISVVIVALAAIKIRRLFLNSKNPSELLRGKVYAPTGVLFGMFLIAFYLLIGMAKPDTFSKHEVAFGILFVLTVLGPTLSYILQSRVDHALGVDPAAPKDATPPSKSTPDKSLIRETLSAMRGASEETVADALAAKLRDHNGAAGTTSITKDILAPFWSKLRFAIWAIRLLALGALGLAVFIFSSEASDLWQMAKYGGYPHFGLLGLAGFLAWRVDLRIPERKKGSPEAVLPTYALALTLICALVYLSVVLFASRVYPYIPVFKGGGDFTQESPALLQFDLAFTNALPADILDRTNAAQSKPIYIIHQNSASFFLALSTTNNNPTTWRLPGHANKPLEIYVVRKEAVVSFRYKQVH